MSITTISRLATLAAFAFLALVSGTVAETVVKVKIKCAICEEQYEATLTASYTQLGQRLDLRPVGHLTSPPRIAVCPKCGFVDFRDGEMYPKDELKELRDFVLSDDYKKLVKTDTPYFRLAKIDERLKKPQQEIAYRYLQASWQVEEEKEKDRPKAYLLAALDAYSKVIADEAAPAAQRQIAGCLKGELLRRLGRFDDARKHFEEFRKLEASKNEPYPRLIELELDLIGKKDAEPHKIPAAKDEK